MVVAITPPTAVKPYTVQNATVTGLAASSNYVMTVMWPTGRTSNVPFKSDGSGNATVPLVGQHEDSGAAQLSVRPAVEFYGQTTAAGTATAFINSGS